LRQQVRASARISGGERGGPLGSQALEPHHVDVVGLNVRDVAGRARMQDVRGQDLAQLGDMDLDHLRRRLWSVLAPEVLDEPIDRDDATGVE